MDSDMLNVRIVTKKYIFLMSISFVLIVDKKLKTLLFLRSINVIG